MELMDPNPFILFADDDPATLDVYRTFADQFGWSAEFVADAEQLVNRVTSNEALGRRQFDAIVCDIGTTEPGTPSNVAAIRALRVAFPDLPVVFVTSYQSYWIKDEIKSIGAEFFGKPANFEQLFERLSYLVRWHRSTMPPPHIAERRRNAINTTEQSRRRTDREVEIPRSVMSATAEVRSARPGGGH